MKHTLLFIFYIIFSTYSFGNVLKVSNTADSGPNTLRGKISSASIGDTILIDVKGTLILNSTLNINKTLTIIGPYAKHFEIRGSNLSGTDVITVSANNVKIEGFAFKLGSNNSFMKVTGSGFEMQYCLFENITSDVGALTIDGGAAVIDGISFISNQTVDDEGVLSIVNNGSISLYNTTFSGNTSSSGASAFSFESGTSYSIHNCTFFQNSGGDAAFLQTDGALGTLSFLSISNSIFMGNTPLSIDMKPISPATITFTTNSGNVFENLSINNYNVILLSSDTYVANNTLLGLEPNIVEGGFGLKYHPIVNVASPAIDYGSNSSVTNATFDGRRMPRILHGSSSNDEDAGAIEYTPFVVINTNGGNTINGSLGKEIQDINAATFTGPYLIEFKIPGTGVHSITQTVDYILNKNEVILNGFTQIGSEIPGPNVMSATSLTAGDLTIDINGNSNIFQANSNDFKMMGIVSRGHNIREIDISGDNIELFGNYFGLDASGNSALTSPTQVFVDGDNFNIGGNSHWKRNVFGGSFTLATTKSVEVRGLNGSIKNNYFGFNADGASSSTSKFESSVHLISTSNNIKVGGKNCIERNVFGNSNIGIFDESSSSKIYGNWFGLDFSGVSFLTGTSIQKGIHLLNSSNSNIGFANYHGANFFANLDIGVHVQNSSGTIVVNSYFGLDSTGNNYIGNNNIGLHIVNSNSITLGNGGPNRGNFFAGGTQQGILINNSNTINIFNNAIGINKNGLISDSYDIGIEIDNGFGISIGSLSLSDRNYFADATTALIYIRNCSNAGVINLNGNVIGQDKNGNDQINDPIGVLIENSITNINIGSPGSANGSNEITNCNTGVIIGGTLGASKNVKILRNKIHDNDLLGIDIYSGGLGVTANNGVLNTSISNDEIDFPEILSANSCDGSSNTRIALKIDAPIGGYSVEVYNNAFPDVSGHGEGQYFFANSPFTSTTNPDTIIISLGSNYPVGTSFTATLTSNTGGTSEFAANYAVTPSYTHSISATNPDCNGATNGEIDIVAVGAIGFSITPGSRVNVSDNHTFNALSANTYDVSIHYSNCQFDTTIILTEPPAIAINNVISDETCGASDGSITITATNGSGSYQYSIDGVVFQNSNVFNGLSAGNYTVYVEDGNGCTATLGATLNNTSLTLNITSVTVTNTICNGSSDGAIQINVSGANSPFNYSLNGNTFVASSLFTGLAAGLYNIEISDNVGCSIDTLNIVVTEPPAVAFTTVATDASCNGSSDASVTITVTTGQAPYSYEIDGNPSVNPNNSLSAGSHSVTVTDGNLCSTTSNITINEPNIVSIDNVNIMSDTCNGGVGELTITGSGGTGILTYSIDNVTYLPSSNFQNLTATSYDVTIIDGNGCSSALQTVTVLNYEGPDPTFTFLDFCPSLAVGPTANSSGGTFSFVSPPADGAIIDPTSGVITDAVGGNSYNVEYQVGPCATNFTQVTVTALLLDDPTFMYDVFCANTPVPAYNITTPGGTFSFENTPVNGETIDVTTGEIYDAIEDTTYNIVYTTSNCPNKDTINITTLAYPVVPILTTPNDLYCVYDSIDDVSISNFVLSNSYSWELNGSAFSTNSSISPDIQPGFNSIFVEVDSNTCSNISDELLIYLSDSTNTSVISPVEVCLGESAQLDALGGGTYLWSGEYSFSDNTSNSPSISVENSGSAFVEIIDTNGCIHELEVQIMLSEPSECDLIIYSAFSPNGDGVNDTWIIDGITGGDNNVKVFNRWGQELHSFDNYDNSTVVWDGNNKKGQKLPNGTYFYIIDIDGNRSSGWVQIN